MFYDAHHDCYLHKHHNTITVEIYRDKFVVNTGGWDTKTTWEFINEWCPIRVVTPLGNIREHKVVVWGKHMTPYHDGIEVDLYGVPLVHKPVRKRRAIRGARKEFYDLAAQVRKLLMSRAMVGEFDHVGGLSTASDSQYLAAMRTLVADEREWWSTDDLRSFFRPREILAFGRPRYQYQKLLEQPMKPAIDRLDSNINAALRAWEYEHSRGLLWETVEVLV